MMLLKEGTTKTVYRILTIINYVNEHSAAHYVIPSYFQIFKDRFVCFS